MDLGCDVADSVAMSTPLLGPCGHLQRVMMYLKGSLFWKWVWCMFCETLLGQKEKTWYCGMKRFFGTLLMIM